MTLTLHQNGLTIDIFDDHASIDGSSSYDKVIQVDKDKVYSPNSQHGINVYKDNTLLACAIILASGGGTTVLSDSALIDDNCLIIRCCNKVFSLSLPYLETNWVTEADWATCFSIHKYLDSYISYGETSIAKIDPSGRIVWSFSGADIFVCIEKGTPFEMHDTYIALTDFNGSRYKIDYDGNSLDFAESGYHKQEAVTVLLNTKKQWWKFW